MCKAVSSQRKLSTPLYVLLVNKAQQKTTFCLFHREGEKFSLKKPFHSDMHHNGGKKDNYNLFHVHFKNKTGLKEHNEYLKLFPKSENQNNPKLEQQMVNYAWNPSTETKV